MQTTLIKIGIGAAIIAALWGLNQWENSNIKEETRTVVEAEARKKTEETINAVSDKAERARLMRRECASRGLRFDFENIRCRQ